jgi:hypothetical protein
MLTCQHVLHSNVCLESTTALHMKLTSLILSSACRGNCVQHLLLNLIATLCTCCNPLNF